jgi:hypothetical protein
VAHACNPSYSGGRDQEDCSSKPAQTNTSRDPIEKPFIKIGLVKWLKVKALSSSPSTAKNKNKRNHTVCTFQQCKISSFSTSKPTFALLFSVFLILVMLVGMSRTEQSYKYL